MLIRQTRHRGNISSEDRDLCAVRTTPPARPPAGSTPQPAEPPRLPAAHKYDSAVGGIRRLLFGRALATSQAGHMKLPVFLALPIFSSDALSSNAYATEAILGVLLLAGATQQMGDAGNIGALHFVIPVALGICLLLATVVLSYRQIIFAYPDGGGAYPVTRDNLGTVPSLVAAASLLVDYVLTVATSVASGVAAIITAVPSLQPHLVPMCYAGILIVTLLNLRGVKEAGWTFAGPSYLFIGSVLATIAAGLIGAALHAPHVAPAVTEGIRAHAAAQGLGAVGLYAVLRAFSMGCTALTGVEAISNTTPLFAEPHAKNAANTTVIMGVLAVLMFFGLSYLAVRFGINNALLDQNARELQERRRPGGRHRLAAAPSRPRLAARAQPDVLGRADLHGPDPRHRRQRRLRRGSRSSPPCWPATTSCPASSPTSATGSPTPTASSSWPPPPAP